MTGLAILVAALVIILGASSSVYAVNGYGASYGPSFGGYSGVTSTVTDTQVLFNDGLTINKNIIDVSKSGTTIKTQTLYAPLTNTITLKIYDNAGSYYIKGGAIFFNLHGTQPKMSNSDTWIQFDKFGGVTLTDPHKILGTVTDKISYNGKYMYVTFTIIPRLPLSTSDLILTTWDNNLSSGTTTVINAIKIA
jgi:hypothetical protein